MICLVGYNSTTHACQRDFLFGRHHPSGLDETRKVGVPVGLHLQPRLGWLLHDLHSPLSQLQRFFLLLLSRPRTRNTRSHAALQQHSTSGLSDRSLIGFATLNPPHQWRPRCVGIYFLYRHHTRTRNPRIRPFQSFWRNLSRTTVDRLQPVPRESATFRICHHGGQRDSTAEVRGNTLIPQWGLRQPSSTCIKLSCDTSRLSETATCQASSLCAAAIGRIGPNSLVRENIISPILRLCRACAHYF